MGSINIIPPVPALSTLVFQPSNATPPPGVYNDWTEMFAAGGAIATPVNYQLAESCTAPPGTWTFKPTDKIVGLGFQQVTLTIADGCVFDGLTAIEFGVAIDSLNTSPTITIPDTATGINIFRIGTRCELKQSVAGEFILVSQTFDTGVFVLVMDINGLCREGHASGVAVRAKHISGASPVSCIVTALTAGGVDRNTFGTFGASEYAVGILQQIGFDQQGFSMDQPQWDAVTGPLVDSQTFVGSPGYRRTAGLVDTSRTMADPYECVVVDTSGGPVTITQVSPCANLPRGAMFFFKKGSSDGNAAIFAPFAGDTVEGAATDSFTNPGECHGYMNDGVGNWERVMGAKETAATPPTPPATDVQIFTANGTWTDPGAKALRVILIAGGGGGAGGACAPLGFDRSGGGGGGGGGVTIKDFTNGEWGTTESVQIGTGGAGGGAGLSGGSNGGPGTNGNPSLFGNLAKADGGGGGAAGTNGADANGGSGAFTTTFAGMDPYAEKSFKSNWGGKSFFSFDADWGWTAGLLPGGGGGGGGLDATETVRAAGSGGMGDTTAGGTGIARGDAGVTGGASPTNGASGAAYNTGGGGGGGGACSDDDTITAQDGADGGLYGGGGGGGGAAIAGGTADAGAGGAGADGICVVISYL